MVAALSRAKAKMKPSADNMRWWVLVTVIIGTFLGRLDQTIVNLALPKIITDFHVTVSQAGWIGTAYILANAVFVPIWGKLGDTVGRKKVYLAGFTIFIVGSVLAAVAWNLSSMLVFRVIQAIAGSADYPTAMAILATTFPEPKDRAQALGIWSSVFGASAALGPLIGGPLIDIFGWRSVFFINLPIGIIGTFMALAFVQESKMPERIVRFDWWGAVTLGISLASIVLVLDQGQSWGWLSSASLITYVVGAAFMAIFIAIEHYHPEPIVDLKFFKNMVFLNTLVNNFITFMGLMGSIFLIPIFAQTFLGYDSTQTGYLFIPMAFGLMFAAPFGAQLVGKVNSGVVIGASTLVAAIGMYLFSFLDVRSTAFDIIIPFIIMAAGLGFGMAQRTQAVAAAVPPSEIGIASSVLALVRNIAGAFGIALFGTLLEWAEKRNVLRIANLSHLYVHTTQNMQTFIGLIELKAQVDAYTLIYTIAASMLAVGAFAAFFIQVKNEGHSEELQMMAE